jgi:galactokinase
MINRSKNIHVSVPGRICLFGEHQDYLGLPVITAAIDLRINISGKIQPDHSIIIELPDINDSESFTIPADDTELKYMRERDYFRSTYNVLHRRGLRLDQGIQCRVRGNIPINSGTSSSSALTVAWVQFLNLAAHKQLTISEKDIAHLAYLAEVAEFGEPGGMMDHYTTALGEVLFIEFDDEVKVAELNNNLATFVLGDSHQPKDTKNILSRVKQGVLYALTLIRNHNPQFSLHDCVMGEIHKYHEKLNESQIQVLEGAIANRDITREARSLFLSDSFDHKEFGRLLNQHHEILDKKLGISTEKINLMIRKSIEAGALGGKINGSGGGGCMFVYAPENPERVAHAIREAGGTPYIIKVGTGIKIH